MIRKVLCGAGAMGASLANTPGANFQRCLLMVWRSYRISSLKRNHPGSLLAATK